MCLHTCVEFEYPQHAREDHGFVNTQAALANTRYHFANSACNSWCDYTCFIRYAEDDVDENILFDEREEGKFKSSNEALIKACTIHKLIERLTYHEYAGRWRHPCVHCA